MTNLVIDLPNMFFRSMHVIGGFGAKSFTFDTQAEVDQLMRKVSTDITYVIRQTNPSRVIFALDSRSWRKSIEIEENEGYKAHREKSTRMNWDNIFATMTEFGEILDTHGFIVSKVENAEADDLIALWCDELLYNQHQHVIMVSSDEDVRQLAKSFPYEQDKQAWAVIFNPFTQGRNAKKKLFYPNGFLSWLETEDMGDIFNRAIDIDKEDFERLRNQEKIVFEAVDGNEIALRKVFCGDDGDNIPPIHSWETTTGKGEKVTRRVTPSIYRKIVDALGVTDHTQLDEKKELIAEQLEALSSVKPAFRIGHRLDRQIKLVVLNPNVFPEKIVEDFQNDLEKQMNKPQVHPQEWNMNSVLSGTRYVKSSGQKNVSSEASIFRDVDNITKQLF